MWQYMQRTLYAFISFKPLNSLMKVFNSSFYVIDSVIICVVQSQLLFTLILQVRHLKRKKE